MVNLEKLALKCQFNEFLVVMVIRNMWFVGKLPPRAYFHSWHSANIWNIFFKICIKSFFFIGMVNLVIIISKLGYLAVKGLRDIRIAIAPTRFSHYNIIMILVRKVCSIWTVQIILCIFS